MMSVDLPEEVTEIPDEVSAGTLLRDVESLIKKLQHREGRWKRGKTIPLPSGLNWTPALVNPSKKEIVHFHFADSLRSYIKVRLTKAFEVGYRVHLVVPLEKLYDAEMLELLSHVDAVVYVASKGRITEAEHHLDVLSKQKVPVDPKTRTLVARAAWALRKKGNANEKGRRFESLLAFLFEQVADFRVVERNYRGDTDEIDICVQIENWSTRCWHQTGVPFVLIEAKNRAESTGQPPVSHLIRRLQTKRGRARIGILLSTSKFTADAELEVVKLAQTELSVALMDPPSIEGWIDAAEPDAYLEGAIRKAMLR